MPKREGEVKRRFVVSLSGDGSRREAFFAQSEAANFEVVNAVDMRGASLDEVDLVFDVDRFNRLMRRSPAAAEAGCTLSHVSIMRTIAEDDSMRPSDIAIICEDDAELLDDFHRVVTKLPLVDFDLLNFHTNKEQAPTYTMSRFATGLGEDRRAGLIWPEVGGGTAGYAVRKRAAVRVIEALDGERPWWLADDFVVLRQFGLRGGSLRPSIVGHDGDAPSSIHDERLAAYAASGSQGQHSAPHYRYHHDRYRRKALWFIAEELRWKLGSAFGRHPRFGWLARLIDAAANKDLFR